MPLMKVNKKLEKFLTLPKPIKVVIGGRGSGKSIGIGDMLSFKMETEGADVYCLREYQDSISDSVHRVFKDSIEKRLKLQGWTIQQNSVIAPNGACTAYKGAARNPDSIQSAQGYKYSWFEESHTASKESLDKLIPTILRNPGAECWFSANPQSSEDAFSQRFIVPFLGALDRDGFYEDDLHYIVVANWRDNPWWNEEQERLRRWDHENRPRAEYDWIWEGKFNDSVENSIIKAEWFDAAIDAHIKLGFKPKGAKVASFDPSDGGDNAGYVLRHGSVFLEVDEQVGMEVNDACDWALDSAIAANVDAFVWDSDGLGLSLRKQIGDSLSGKNIIAVPFRGGAGVDDPEKQYQQASEISKALKNEDAFKNKRAQYFWYLRDRFYNTYRAVTHGEYTDPDTMISVSSTIKSMTKFRAEVCRIPQKNNGGGLIQIMAKDEMKNKYRIESPGLADSAMMGLSHKKTTVEQFFRPIKQPVRKRLA